MRGNRVSGDDISGPRGSIPAHAGEPWHPSADPFPSGVYPRTCGGTRPASAGRRRAAGLSPHMRGNPLPMDRSRNGDGSIPAHAGEPTVAPPADRSAWVYPRTCGGTPIKAALLASKAGLSPHMRGNLDDGATGRIIVGSIPAHAGEPWSSWLFPCSITVYPRTCGGTRAGRQLAQIVAGLSPHMRGNLVVVPLRFEFRGSIPAHAGEPSERAAVAAADRVYPRTCGGTGHRIRARSSTRGLSPHMRGNRRGRQEDMKGAGSIPAHAGEPSVDRTWRRTASVYPRTCGGTKPSSSKWLRMSGLSPHMRGNLLLDALRLGGRGSIPAHAGEPSRILA